VHSESLASPEITDAPDRSYLLRRGLRLEYFTVGWNLVEGIVAVLAASAAGSIALLGFGIDSFVETASGFILIWRLRSEQGSADPAAIARLDRRAHRLVGLSLFALALYVAADATMALWRSEKPEPSAIGIALTAVSLVVMLRLARAKRAVGRALGSRAMVADAFQTTACWWLSLVALGGMALNAAVSWWWADPVAALVMCILIVREGREAWKGAVCC
jgi:divalent metal cation (Fe/Co/Zn/Cd) transporter